MKKSIFSFLLLSSILMLSTVGQAREIITLYYQSEQQKELYLKAFKINHFPESFLNWKKGQGQNCNRSTKDNSLISICILSEEEFHIVAESMTEFQELIRPFYQKEQE